MILGLRTDNPEAEVVIYNQSQNTVVGRKTWHAHRQLVETIHTVIGQLLKEQGITYQDLTGVVVYRGPGSFTGLRIGISVANALAYGLNIVIVGSEGEDWLQDGITALQPTKRSIIVPEYGAPAHTTSPRK